MAEDHDAQAFLEQIELDFQNRTHMQRVEDFLKFRVPDAAKRANTARKDAVQRAGRGWADNDVWGLKWHLAKVTGEMLLHLADNGYSYPGRGEYASPEAWRDALRKHGHALVNAFDGPEADTSSAKAAFHWVADNFDDLWD